MRSILKNLAYGFLIAAVAGVEASPLEIRSTDSYPGLKKLKYWFSFGDSYTQTGFNLTNGQPLPTVGNPMGNPPFPGWTAANGPNWVGYMATKYNQSSLMMYNLAYGGATIDSAIVKPWRDDVLSFKDQVEKLFLPILGPKPTFAPWKAKDSLFSIFIGINDIGNSYWSGDYDNFHKVLLDAYFALVEKLYTSGARNFLFINVPPIDRSPLTMGQGQQAVALEVAAIASFNAKLAQRAKDLTSTHNDVWSKVFDYSSVFTNILDHPGKYGLKNVTAYCEAYQNGTPAWDTFYPECGVPVNEYFWLNSLHPGYKVNDAMATELAKEVK